MLRAGAYRRRIENRIRAGNTALPSMADMRVAVLLVASRRCIAALSYEWPASSSSTDSASPTAPPPVHVPRRERREPARRGRRSHPRRHDGLRRRGSPASPSSTPICSPPCAERRPMPRPPGSGSPSTAAGAPRRTRSSCSSRRSRSTARKRRRPAGWPLPDVRAREGGRGRHRFLRSDVAVRARRRVRPVPGLRQRALALRTAIGGRRSRLPSRVRRPDPRSKDAAVTRLIPLLLVALIAAGCGSNDTVRDPRHRHRQSQEAHRSGEGGEVRRVHPCARRRRLPDPNAKNEFEYGVSVTPAVWKRATTACKDLQPPGTLSSKRTPKEQSAAPSSSPSACATTASRTSPTPPTASRSSTPRRSRPG